MLFDLMTLVRDSVVNPREGASTILSFAPRRRALGEMAVLVTVLGAIAAVLTTFILPVQTDRIIAVLLAQPVWLAVLQLLVLVASVAAIYYFGRIMGGHGSLDETLLLFVWMQFIMLVVQVAQWPILLIAPGLSGLVTLANLILFMWIFINFVATLHGFASLRLVFAGVVAFTVAIGFAIVFFLGFVGLIIEGG